MDALRALLRSAYDAGKAEDELSVGFDHWLANQASDQIFAALIEATGMDVRPKLEFGTTVEFSTHALSAFQGESMEFVITHIQRGPRGTSVELQDKAGYTRGNQAPF